MTEKGHGLSVNYKVVEDGTKRPLALSFSQMLSGLTLHVTGTCNNVLKMLITAITMSTIKEASSCAELSCCSKADFSRDNYFIH